jgi:hypothetical protein
MEGGSGVGSQCSSTIFMFFLALGDLAPVVCSECHRTEVQNKFSYSKHHGHFTLFSGFLKDGIFRKNLLLHI